MRPQAGDSSGLTLPLALPPEKAQLARLCEEIYCCSQAELPPQRAREQRLHRSGNAGKVEGAAGQTGRLAEPKQNGQDPGKSSSEHPLSLLRSPLLHRLTLCRPVLQYMPLRSKVRHSNLYPKNMGNCAGTPPGTVSSAQSHSYKVSSSAHTTIFLSSQTLRLYRHSWEHHSCSYHTV